MKYLGQLVVLGVGSLGLFGSYQFITNPRFADSRNDCEKWTESRMEYLKKRKDELNSYVEDKTDK